ncbi:MAG: tetratricopeptide repeat protein [Candidatus Jordarchaeaceae archaeon]
MDFLEMGRFYEKLGRKSASLIKKDLRDAGYWYSSAADCYKLEGDEENFRRLKNLALKCFLDYLEESRKKNMLTDTGPVYLWASHIYRSLGNMDEFHKFVIEAAKAFTLTAKNLPKNSEAILQAIICYYNSANCFWLIGDKSNAEKNYQNALNIYRRESVKYKGIAFSPVLQAACYYRMGAYEDAINILERALENEHISPLVFSNINLILGCYYLENDDKKNAEKHFQEAKISFDVEKLSAAELATQALCQLMLNNSDNAIGLAELALKLSSKSRKYNLRQLIQEIGGIALYLASGEHSIVEKIMESLTWQHLELPLYDALNIITKKRIKKR